MSSEHDLSLRSREANEQHSVPQYAGLEEKSDVIDLEHCRNCNVSGLTQEQVAEHYENGRQRMGSRIIQKTQHPVNSTFHCEAPQCCFATTSLPLLGKHKLVNPAHSTLDDKCVLASISTTAMMGRNRDNPIAGIVCHSCRRCFRDTEQLKNHVCNTSPEFNCPACQDHGYPRTFFSIEELHDHLEEIHQSKHLKFWVKSSCFRGHRKKAKPSLWRLPPAREGNRAGGAGGGEGRSGEDLLPDLETYVYIPETIPCGFPADMIKGEVLDELVQILQDYSFQYSSPFKMITTAKSIVAKHGLEGAPAEYQKTVYKTQPVVILEESVAQEKIVDSINEVQSYSLNMHGIEGSGLRFISTTAIYVDLIPLLSIRGNGKRRPASSSSSSESGGGDTDSSSEMPRSLGEKRKRYQYESSSESEEEEEGSTSADGESSASSIGCKRRRLDISLSQSDSNSESECSDSPTPTRSRIWQQTRCAQERRKKGKEKKRKKVLVKKQKRKTQYSKEHRFYEESNKHERNRQMSLTKALRKAGVINIISDLGERKCLKTAINCSLYSKEVFDEICEKTKCETCSKYSKHCMKCCKEAEKVYFQKSEEAQTWKKYENSSIWLKEGQDVFDEENSAKTISSFEKLNPAATISIYKMTNGKPYRCYKTIKKGKTEQQMARELERGEAEAEVFIHLVHTQEQGEGHYRTISNISLFKRGKRPNENGRNRTMSCISCNKNFSLTAKGQHTSAKMIVDPQSIHRSGGYLEKYPNAPNSYNDHVDGCQGDLTQTIKHPNHKFAKVKNKYGAIDSILLISADFETRKVNHPPMCLVCKRLYEEVSDETVKQNVAIKCRKEEHFSAPKELCETCLFNLEAEIQSRKCKHKCLIRECKVCWEKDVFSMSCSHSKTEESSYLLPCAYAISVARKRTPGEPALGVQLHKEIYKVFFFYFFIFIFYFLFFLIKKFFQENSDPAALMREFWEDISQVAEVSSKHSSITCINYTFSGNAAEIHRTQKQNVSYPSTFFSIFPPFHLSTFSLLLQLFFIGSN